MLHSRSSPRLFPVGRQCGGRPGIAPDWASPQAEDLSMSAQHPQPMTASLASAIAAWYAATTDGDTTIITLPDAPAISLTHQPHEQVRWRTEGRKGLTIPLADARERLAMVLGSQREAKVGSMAWAALTRCVRYGVPVAGEQ